jgi:hypothetical protein
MFEDLTGAISGVSGEVQELEARVLDLEGIIMNFPDADDFSTQATLNAARFNTLSSQYTTLANSLATLQTYVVNLKLSHTSLQYQFTGHTGVWAQSGHYGGLTGEI